MELPSGGNPYHVHRFSHRKYLFLSLAQLARTTQILDTDIFNCASIHMRLRQMLESNWSSLIDAGKSNEEKQRRNWANLKLEKNFSIVKNFTRIVRSFRERVVAGTELKNCVRLKAWGRRWVFFSCERKYFLRFYESRGRWVTELIIFQMVFKLADERQ